MQRQLAGITVTMGWNGLFVRSEAKEGRSAAAAGRSMLSRHAGSVQRGAWHVVLAACGADRKAAADGMRAKYQSDAVDRNGRISRCGDEMMRVMLYEAAQSMLRSKKWSWLKAWAMKIARHRGMKKAIAALARRLAVIMHRIWVDGTEFRWTREQATAAA